MSPDLRQLYLERLRSTWRVLGAEDPLWAILSRPDKRGNRWNIDEFFKSGEAEIAAIEQYCTNLHRPDNRNAALDFGCGVGRLTRALSSRYTNVVGVDISSSMIGRAKELHADLSNLRFVENVQLDLRFVDDASIDFIYSVITLHHMPAALQRNYIAEFMRVLAPRVVVALHERRRRRYLVEHDRASERTACRFIQSAICRECAA